MTKFKPVGQTASSGFQVGVRRTFPITVEDAWSLITEKGLEIWLGEVSSFSMQVGQQYMTSDGVSGEIRVVNQYENIRLTWKKAEWSKASTLQIRTISNHPDKTILSFHQENLADVHIREEMKMRWEETLDRLRNS